MFYTLDFACTKSGILQLCDAFQHLVLPFDKVLSDLNFPCRLVVLLFYFILLVKTKHKAQLKTNIFQPCAHSLNLIIYKDTKINKKKNTSILFDWTKLITDFTGKNVQRWQFEFKRRDARQPTHDKNAIMKIPLKTYETSDQWKIMLIQFLNIWIPTSQTWSSVHDFIILFPHKFRLVVKKYFNRSVVLWKYDS